MPSASDVALLREANIALSGRVLRDLRAFWASLDLGKPEACRDALVRFLPVLTTTYGQAAAVVAADWYDDIRAAEGVRGRFRATTADPFPTEYVEARVRYGARHLFTASPALMLPFLDGVAQEYAMQPGRDTIVHSTLDDPQAAGWHRETRGDACKFCRMLAGRGGVYRRETASFAAHGDCNCVAAPSWDADAEEVPASAYVASRKTSGMSEAVKARHTARVREYLAAL